jgi:hypothetical protein
LRTRDGSAQSLQLFLGTRSGTEIARQLQAEGRTSKTGRLLNKGDVSKLLNNRTYVGEAAHKGKVYPGEHQPIIDRALWDGVHAVLKESPRSRGNATRNQTQALLKGLVFGADGLAMSPTHTRRRGRLYRYYVSQGALKETDRPVCANPAMVRRISAAEIKAAVVGQVRALLRQPEIIVGTWAAARTSDTGLTAADTGGELHQLDPLWDELFPAEQARTVRLLLEKVTVSSTGADIRLRVEGLASLVRDRGGDLPAVLETAE